MLDVAYVAGFSDPGAASQMVFRLLLDGMASPGSILTIPDLGGVHPPALDYATAGIILAIADPETPVWFSDAFRTDVVSKWLRFHSGAPAAAEPSEGTFAVTRGTDADGVLGRFAIGDDRYPDRSATVLVSCASLAGGDPVVLTGPGIPAPRTVAPSALRDGFWKEAKANHARFPLGVDLIFVSGASFFCLPRSTNISAEGAF